MNSPMTGEKDSSDHIPDAGNMVDAPAEMPGVEEIARAIYEAQGFAYEGKTVLADGTPYAEWAKAVSGASAALTLFAPILAEKEREKAAALGLIEGHSVVISQLEARALAAEAALAAERDVNALTKGTLLRGLVAELARGQRSYPAAYQRGHTLVGFGLAEYVDEPVENRSYWLRLTDAGHALAAAIRAEGE